MRNVINKGICRIIQRAIQRHAGSKISSLSFDAMPMYNTLFFSSKETQWFLKKMNSMSESDCDCLPDCELTEFQHSHSITNLM